VEVPAVGDGADGGVGGPGGRHEAPPGALRKSQRLTKTFWDAGW
jgi:hypothetical protein